MELEMNLKHLVGCIELDTESKVDAASNTAIAEPHKDQEQPGRGDRGCGRARGGGGRGGGAGPQVLRGRHPWRHSLQVQV